MIFLNKPSLTFYILVPFFPVVQVHVHIREQSWRTTFQDTEHFILIKSSWLWKQNGRDTLLIPELSFSVSQEKQLGLGFNHINH